MKWLYFPDWLPENVSTFGTDVDKLFVLIYWITSIVFVAVMAVLIGFIIKYRFQAGRKAGYIEGSTTLEITWTAATTVTLFSHQLSINRAHAQRE